MQHVYGKYMNRLSPYIPMERMIHGYAHRYGEKRNMLEQTICAMIKSILKKHNYNLLVVLYCLGACAKSNFMAYSAEKDYNIANAKH